MIRVLHSSVFCGSNTNKTLKLAKRFVADSISSAKIIGGGIWLIPQPGKGHGHSKKSPGKWWHVWKNRQSTATPEPSGPLLPSIPDDQSQEFDTATDSMSYSGFITRRPGTAAEGRDHYGGERGHATEGRGHYPGGRGHASGGRDHAIGGHGGAVEERGLTTDGRGPTTEGRVLATEGRGLTTEGRGLHKDEKPVEADTRVEEGGEQPDGQASVHLTWVIVGVSVGLVLAVALASLFVFYFCNEKKTEVCPCYHSYPFIILFIHPFILHSSVHFFLYSFTHLFICSFIFSFKDSLKCLKYCLGK